MTQTLSAPVILWEHFAPGTLLGECTQTYDTAQASRWQALFGCHATDGAGGYAEQAGMATIMMMRAFLHIVAPRPPGNIHAGQKLTLHDLPHPDETVRLSVRCLDKRMRKERRFVDLSVACHGLDGRAIFRGELTLIWAA